MKIIITLLSLSLITFSCDLSSAETKAKPSTSHKTLPSAEKKIDGIPRSTDKDHNPTEPFHIARTPAEKVLDDIFHRAEKDKNILDFVLGIPEYDAKKDSGYSRLFTKKFLRAVAKSKKDINPITCAQDDNDSGYLYRTVEDDGHKAKIISIWVGYAIRKIQSSYRLIKIGEDWKLDDVNCNGGEGFNKDCRDSLCAEDVPYFYKKAKAGDPDAQFTLGIMYYAGIGGLWNMNKAADWFRKAGEQGHADAQFYLGELYYYGRGVEMDFAESDKWYQRAAEQGHADAQIHLGNKYWSGRNTQQDFAESARWFRKAAEQGHISAQVALGEMYELGQGVQQDYAEALKWYLKAANLGDNRAQFALGELYRLGQGVQPDYAEAERWYRLSAERNYSAAQYQLGLMYEMGRGVQQDYAEAAKWYRKAEFDADAEYHLGNLYKYGLGVQQDSAEAENLFRSAANRGHQGAKQELENLGRR